MQPTAASPYAMPCAAGASAQPIYLHALRRDDEPDGSLHPFYTSPGFIPAQEETIEGIRYQRWIRHPQAMDAAHT